MQLVAAIIKIKTKVPEIVGFIQLLNLTISRVAARCPLACSAWTVAILISLSLDTWSCLWKQTNALTNTYTQSQKELSTSKQLAQFCLCLPPLFITLSLLQSPLSSSQHDRRYSSLIPLHYASMWSLRPASSIQK